MALIIGTTRRISSSAETHLAPGRVDSPPTSMMLAPASNISATCSNAFSKVTNSPPSEKESGVTLSIPIIAAFPASSCFPMFISLPTMNHIQNLLS